MGTKQKIKKENWKEYPDPSPIEIPAELKRPESMDQRIKRLVHSQIQAKAMEEGFETFEEANDFEVDDSFDGDGIMSPYDVQEMEPEYPVNEFPSGSPVKAEKQSEEGEVPSSSDNKEEKNGKEIFRDGNSADVGLHGETGNRDKE